MNDSDATVTPSTSASLLRVTPTVYAPTIRIREHLWRVWCHVAIEHALHAWEVRRRGDDLEHSNREFARCFGEELRAGLVSVCAAAFALDAFYGAIKDIAIPPDPAGDDPPRHSYVFEAVKSACQAGQAQNQWGKDIKWLYQLRDLAVHFEEADRDPMPHPIGTNTGPLSQEYSAENSVRAVDLVLQILEACATQPRPPFQDWAPNFSGAVRDLRELRVQV